MGRADVRGGNGGDQMRLFMQQVLDDVRALELMIEGGTIEDDITRIGAEQELFLVNPETLRPSFRAMEALTEIDDPHFTTELGKFNLECNLDPFELKSGCLIAMETQLRELLAKARAGANRAGADILLVGILPTLEKGDLSLDNMAPIPRYFELDRAMRQLRGEDFDLHIKGRDDLTIRHGSVMLESCNTSFQVHFQVAPEQFVDLYNIAQLVAGPTLAAATFSPMLFGRRLWSETRIAVFQQSIDTRRSNIHHRLQHPRVRFGERWVEDSVLDIFRQDIALFRLVLTTETEENSLECLEQGKIPQLSALRLHNGTVYRWNRPCYGVGGGKPHLRIENRILPSGPTVLDEMANAAFWFGLLRSLAVDLGDVRPLIGFDSVKTNFLAAARSGLQAQFRWIDGRQHSAQDLILQELIPRSREGLVRLGLDREEIDRYLPLIEERVSSLRTGSSWLMGSLEAMETRGTPSERISAVMVALRELQQKDEPVHTWPPAELGHAEQARHHHFARVADLMSTNLFTVAPDEVIDLVAAVMDWKYIHHIPVEDSEHRLVGLVTHRRLLRYLAQNQGKDRRPVPVSEVMERDLITVTPQTSSLEAVQRMKAERIACLPVVEDGHLVGIITERDFIKVTDKLLEDFLSSA